jgi:hypothetical protein
MFLDEIQDWLAIAQDIAISKSTLHDNIHDCGIIYIKCIKLLLPRNGWLGKCRCRTTG